MVIPSKVVMKRLENIAFDVAYRDIIYNLLLSPEHVSQKPSIASSFSYGVSCSSILSLHVTSKSIIEFVRDHLDQKLIGTMSDTIRKRLIIKFFLDLNKRRDESKLTPEMPDAWAFFDCVLDESITALDLPTCEPNFGTDPKLFEVIAHRAPHLTYLFIDFECSEQMCFFVQKAFTNCLFSLKHLNKLYLMDFSCHLSPAEYISFLSHLGNSCPQLTYLYLTSDRFEEEHILALVLGERAYIIPKSAKKRMWGADWSNMHSIQISKEYLTPICFSLKELDVWYPTEDEKGCDDCGGEKLTSNALSSAAFVLRHLPNLEEVVSVNDFCGCLDYKALKLLHQPMALCQSRSGLWRRECREYEEAYQFTGDLYNPLSSSHDLKLTFNSSFSGSCGVTLFLFYFLPKFSKKCYS